MDERLFQLLVSFPEGLKLLSHDEIRMIERRQHGATLREIADEFHMTAAGVRARLYGTGRGSLRRGGALGRLRGLARRKPT